MNLTRFKLVINTLKYLKFKQVYYRVKYMLRKKLVTTNYNKPLLTKTRSLNWTNNFSNPSSFKPAYIFTFLNIEHSFEKIDWNYNEYGKLWTYNLNYFDFLHQKELSKEEGLLLIHDYIKNKDSVKDGLEPYPISLRGINWIKFLSIHKIIDPEIDSFLYNNCLQLLDNLEYHILGNHLLENGFSLLFGAHYFNDSKFYKVAQDIVKKELQEQILDDGAHFERSPMYHQIMLWKLLDCIQLVQFNRQSHLEPFLLLMESKAKDMLSFMEEICFDNGNFPQFNDAAYGIVPVKKQLLAYAASLGLKHKKIPLSSSGYRKIKQDDLEIIVNIGQIGPSYQPGHAHADTFSFCLNYKGKPIIVDTGTSTYNIGNRRDLERSTLAHNTVAYDGQNSSEVWDGFRVADRAKVSIEEESLNCISISHDGYRKSGVIHERKFDFTSVSFTISDKMKGNVKNESHSSLHFHPEVKIDFKENSMILNDNLKLTWKGFDEVSLDDYSYAPEFNTLMNIKKLSGKFKAESKFKLEIIKD